MKSFSFLFCFFVFSCLSARGIEVKNQDPKVEKIYNVKKTAEIETWSEDHFTGAVELKVQGDFIFDFEIDSETVDSFNLSGAQHAFKNEAEGYIFSFNFLIKKGDNGGDAKITLYYSHKDYKVDYTAGKIYSKKEFFLKWKRDGKYITFSLLKEKRQDSKYDEKSFYQDFDKIRESRTKKTVKNFFKEADLDGDGKVSVDQECVTYISKKCAGNEKGSCNKKVRNEVVKICPKYDLNKNGYIEQKEMFDYSIKK